MHCDADATTQGEAFHNRNIDETFNNETVVASGRCRINGETPNWMLMTGFGPGSVEMTSMGLDPKDNLTMCVHVRHKGDSVEKTIPFWEFVCDDFENTSQWPHKHGTPEESHQDQTCHKVARCKWWSLAFRSRTVQEMEENPMTVRQHEVIWKTDTKSKSMNSK